MFDAITIFLLIGLAHWVSHLVQCQDCQKTFHGNTKFVLDGIVLVFGWPMHAAEYIHRAFFTKAPIFSDADKIKMRDEIIAKLSADDAEKYEGAQIVEVIQEPGESMEAFEKRIKALLGDHITSMNKNTPKQ